MKNLPPLKALIAFEAAVRHKSFSTAAAELHVTPGAVGQMIRKLEEWLGAQLFHREVRRVSVTPAGAAYYGSVSVALSQIAQASSSLRERQRTGVRISMPPTFATKWFASRMERFIQLYPHINLQISSSTALVDFASDDVHLAVRHFSGAATGNLESELLFPEEVRVYCSRQYRARLKLKEPGDIRRGTLLATTLHPHWEQWFENFSKLSKHDVEKIAAIRFDQTHLAIEAAKRHQGLVLTSSLLAEEEVANEELIEPFEAPIYPEHGYHLVHPRDACPAGSAVDTLKRWLRQEAAEYAPLVQAGRCNELRTPKPN